MTSAQLDRGTHSVPGTRETLFLIQTELPSLRCVMSSDSAIMKLTHTGSWAVRVPQMENAQREAGQGLAVLPRFAWNASYWSNEMYRIFGLDPGPTPPSYMELVGRLHPEDARYSSVVVEQAIRDRSDFETEQDRKSTRLNSSH